MELFSPGHLVVLAIVVAVLFFGWKQLPDMSRSLGRSLRIFRTELKGMSDDDVARAAQPTVAVPVQPVAPTPVPPTVAIEPTPAPQVAAEQADLHRRTA